MKIWIDFFIHLTSHYRYLMKLTLKATTKSGKAIEAMQALIKRRAEVLHETTEKSCIALAIQTLKSLRAATKKSDTKVKGIKEGSEPKDDFDICYKEIPEYVVGYKYIKGGQRLPCIRHGLKGPQVTDKKFWWRTGRQSQAVYQSKVYKVTISSSRHQAWKKPVESYIVAISPEAVVQALKWRFSFVVKKDSQLGRSAWTRAMMMTSQKNAKLENQIKQNVLSDNIIVVKNLNSNFSQSEGSFSITINNNLSYADKSLKNGQQEVTLAMAKAVNSVNGFLNKYADKHKQDFFDDDVVVEKWDRIFPSEFFNIEGEG